MYFHLFIFSCYDRRKYLADCLELLPEPAARHCHSRQAPLGGRPVPDQYSRTKQAHCTLIGWHRCLSPPTFPGMTFSLGNHFLWASATTAIFNPEPFMKSCSAHVNKQSRAFAHKDRHHSPGWFVAAAHTRRAEEKRTVKPRRPVWFQWTPTGQSTCLDHHHSSRVCLLNHGVF